MIAGDPQAADTRQMVQALRRQFIPNKVVLLRAPGGAEEEITRLAEFTRYQSSLQGRATAYVCLNYRCQLPTTEISQMLKSLSTGPRAVGY